jgi:AraC family transcriptional regulator of adaptative response/methylated-DNA-[protein]-cysteine methyltransferase
MKRDLSSRDWIAFSGHRATASRNEDIRLAFGHTTMGCCLVATSDKGLVSVSIGKDQTSLIETLRQEFPLADLVRERGTLDDFVPRVVEFIERPIGRFDLPMDLRGSEFQKRVWRAVQSIPCGETSSYSQVAAQIGHPKAIRAVASSCSKCRFPIIVPCHRVLHKDGSPTGGGGELNWQRVLMARETQLIGGGR